MIFYFQFLVHYIILHNTYVYIIFIILQINEKIREMTLMDQYSVSCLPTGPNRQLGCHIFASIHSCICKIFRDLDQHNTSVLLNIIY